MKKYVLFVLCVAMMCVFAGCTLYVVIMSVQAECAEDAENNKGKPLNTKNETAYPLDGKIETGIVKNNILTKESYKATGNLAEPKETFLKKGQKKTAGKIARICNVSKMQKCKDRMHEKKIPKIHMR